MRVTEQEIRRGSSRMLGVTKIDKGYNFAVSVPDAQDAALLLYEKGSQTPLREVPLPKEERVGSVAAVWLAGFKAGQFEYNYRVGKQIVQDPYAYQITGREEFGALPDLDNPHSVRCGFLPEKLFPWETDSFLQIPYEDTVLYKIHVRGYTKGKYSKVRKKGTFAGVTEKIPYLKELGITSVELMPAYEFQEVRIPDDIPSEYASRFKGRFPVNCWGYAPGFYFAPKNSYSNGQPVTEFKSMVNGLHAAGLECLMEFYFPGNTNPLLVLDVLRFWKAEYHIDGFHLAGEGVPCELLTRDPLLCTTKLLFTDVDDGRIYQGELPSVRNLAEYNQGFEEDMRRFLKSDEDSLGAAVYRMRRNPAAHAVINYMAIQDGFTLHDLVSYDRKHNEANGEGNRDGNSYNYSWNCGVEGPSRRNGVRRLRDRQLRNALLFLFLSQGVPLLYGGDEIGNSQEGNNNAYCQDNEIGWVDWSGLRRNSDLLEFTRNAVRFRREHPVLHMKTELRIMDYLALGYPDISYHSQRAWYSDFDNTSRHVGIMYCGDYAKNGDGTEDDFIYIACNFHWELHSFALPNLPGDKSWRMAVNTDDRPVNGFYPKGEEKVLGNQKMMEVAPRTIIVLLGK